MSNSRRAFNNDLEMVPDPDDIDAIRELQFAEPEAYSFNKESEFNQHQRVMISSLRCFEAGAKEMRKGWTETKINKMGGTTVVVHEDTRQVFQNCVEMYKSIMKPYFDDKATNNIKKCYKDLADKKKAAIDAEEKWYNSLVPQMRSRYPHMTGSLNIDLPFYQMFMQDSIAIYRLILEELEELLLRLKHFRKTVNKA